MVPAWRRANSLKAAFGLLLLSGYEVLGTVELLVSRPRPNPITGLVCGKEFRVWLEVEAFAIRVVEFECVKFLQHGRLVWVRVMS